jgi:rhamnogalacturonyl hydrolase YesR
MLTIRVSKNLSVISWKYISTSIRTDIRILLDSIRAAAATVAYDLQTLYNGNKTGGVLGKFPYPPYYWWESGAAWGGMINYWHFTGDNSYVDVTHAALVSQIGPNNDFILPQERFDTVSQPFRSA